MLGTSKVIITNECINNSGDPRTIGKILAAYHDQASNSLEGPSSLGLPPSTSNNIYDNLYQYYVRLQRDLMLTKSNNAEKELNCDNFSDEETEDLKDDQISSRSDNESVKIVDAQHKHIMNLYRYYQNFCNNIKVPPHALNSPNLFKYPIRSDNNSEYCFKEDQDLKNNIFSFSKSSAPEDIPIIHSQHHFISPWSPYLLGIHPHFDPQLLQQPNPILNKAMKQPNKTILQNCNQISELLPEVTYTNLEGHSISCFDVGGEKRLCLPQVLNIVLKNFSLREINSACDTLHIFCSRCDSAQLSALKRLGFISLAASDCGLITKTDSERLSNTLLRSHNLKPQSIQNDQLSSPLRNNTERITTATPSSSSSSISSSSPGYHPVSEGFVVATSVMSGDRFRPLTVYHECFGRCTGRVLENLYTDQHKPCIECTECGLMLAPSQFVSHSHRPAERRVCHWGFDPERWRSYLLLPTRGDTILRNDPKMTNNQSPASTSPDPFDTGTDKEDADNNDGNEEARLKAFKEKFLDSPPAPLARVQSQPAPQVSPNEDRTSTFSNENNITSSPPTTNTCFSPLLIPPKELYSSSGSQNKDIYPHAKHRRSGVKETCEEEFFERNKYNNQTRSSQHFYLHPSPGVIADPYFGRNYFYGLQQTSSVPTMLQPHHLNNSFYQLMMQSPYGMQHFNNNNGTSGFLDLSNNSSDYGDLNRSRSHNRSPPKSTNAIVSYSPKPSLSPNNTNISISIINSSSSSSLTSLSTVSSSAVDVARHHLDVPPFHSSRSVDAADDKIDPSHHGNRLRCPTPVIPHYNIKPHKRSSAHCCDVDFGNSKRKRYLSVPEGIQLIATSNAQRRTNGSGKEGGEKVKEKNKSSNSVRDMVSYGNKVNADDDYQVIPSPQNMKLTPTHLKNDEFYHQSDDDKKRVTTLGATLHSTVTSHFVSLSRDLITELDGYVKRVEKVAIACNTNRELGPLAEEFKGRILGYITQKHSSLQSSIDKELNGFDND